MKNFFFPQIFVPILGSNDPSSQSNDKNRMRTWTEPEDQKEFKHPNFAKTSRVKFLIQPPKTGKLRISLLGAQQEFFKDRLEGQEGKTRESIGKSFGLEESINQISKLEKPQNKFRISQTTKRLWQNRKSKDEEAEKDKEKKKEKEKEKDKENIERAKWSNKTINKLKKSKNRGEQKIEQKPLKGLKKDAANKVTKENAKSSKGKKQSQKKGSQKKKQKQRQQNNKINDERLKQENNEQKENSRIGSHGSTSKTKRRNGIQANIQLTDLQMTEEMKKILNTNNRILGTTSNHYLKKTKHDLWARQAEDQNEENIVLDEEQPKERAKETCPDQGEFHRDTRCKCQSGQHEQCCIYRQKIESQNSNEDSDGMKGNFQKTCHFLDSKRPRQIRLHKRSYTIWDTQSNSSNEKDGNVSQKVLRQKSDEKKSPVLKKARSNKKVRFMKTSTEIKKEKSRRTQIDFPGSDESRRSIKYKGVLHRNTSEELQHPSIKDLLLGDPKSKKIFSNVLTEQKKAPRLKKVDTQNVYNELNYFRMRLNLSQPLEQEIEVKRNYPQNIHFSVEKVKNQSDYQRIQSTKRSNMIIDFGIKVTKDCTLNQRAARDRAVYNFY